MSLILDLLFPRHCLACGKKSDSYFCSSCFKQQPINFIDIDNPHHFPSFQGSLSLFKYNSLVRQLITEIKYNFVTDAVDPFINTSASILKKQYPHLIDYWRQNNFVLTPIPLHHSRQNWRGFNQSALLASKLAKKLKLKFSDQLLLRTKKTHIQAKLINPSSKVTNLENAFTLSGQKIPSNLIIFDDVTTTFSTLNSALKTLSLNDDLIHCYFLTLAA